MAIDTGNLIKKVNSSGEQQSYPLNVPALRTSMTNVTSIENEQPSVTTSYVAALLDKMEKIIHDHRQKDPDLYRIVEEKKLILAAKQTALIEKKEGVAAVANTRDPKQVEPLYFKQYQQKQLKQKIVGNQNLIHEQVLATQAMISPRTKARNAKQPYVSVDAMKTDRADKLSEQIKAWRGLLPILIKQFAKIVDTRRAKSVKHQIAVVMLYGLFAFIFRLSSRREMNRELSGAVIFENLQKLFPELESIPHADTLARVLAKINVHDIEKTHVQLIYQLIRNKKFKKLLISGCLPVAIDGTQKLYRDGELHDLCWLSRKVGHEESGLKQQYVYVLEANIVFKNGLTIPLLTEYLKTDWSLLNTEEGKQECELIAFERLAKKLKCYFPRLKIMILGDALFATQTVLDMLSNYQWEHMIQFSKNKNKRFAELLNTKRKTAEIIPDQPYYRERHQQFYWYNDVMCGDGLTLKKHLVSCLEEWNEVDKSTGEMITKHSQHQWISSIKINIKNVHELCNLCARKIGLMEDSIHTEKHRGYHYEHAYSYNWNAMRGFHFLMRLAHAVNALSEFTKKLKKWIKEQGCSAILKLIKETIFNPWLSKEWYEEQHKNPIRLTLQLE